MRSEKLAKLETLSEEQAELSRRDAEIQRNELSLLNRQHLALKSMNDEYQTSLIGSDQVAPQILAQRRAFVAQLSQKLDVLKAESLRQSELLQEKVEVQHQHTAQTAAIGSMVERERGHEQLAAVRQEQRQQDNAQFALRQFHVATDDNDYE